MILLQCLFLLQWHLKNIFLPHGRLPLAITTSLCHPSPRQNYNTMLTLTLWFNSTLSTNQYVPLIPRYTDSNKIKTIVCVCIYLLCFIYSTMLLVSTGQRPLANCFVYLIVYFILFVFVHCTYFVQCVFSI